LDSRGLEALTALQRACRDNLGLLKLCGVDATIGKILEMTRLNRTLECCRDLDAAMASICCAK
jgi:anti-anti-sigma regulatory factor